MILDDNLKKIIKLVSLETKIPEPTVEVAYRLYWKFIQESLEKVPMKDIYTIEEYNKYKTSINLPSLGKIFIGFDKIQKSHRRYEYAMNLFKKQKEEENE